MFTMYVIGSSKTAHFIKTHFPSDPDHGHGPLDVGSPVHNITGLGLIPVPDDIVPTPDLDVLDVALISVDGMIHDLQNEDTLDTGE